MATSLNWHCNSPDLHTACTTERLDRTKLHLLVEQLHDGRWDWAVWSIKGVLADARGVAPTCDQAMLDAEAISEALLEEIPRPAPPFRRNVVSWWTPWDMGAHPAE